MNFQILNKQRKFILLAAGVGIISLFLPWAVIDLFMMHKNVNGFHSYGVAVFLAFATIIVICFLGDQQRALDKIMWTIAMAAGIAALLFTIIFLMNLNSAAGLVVKTGFGIWISLLAAVAAIIIGWLFKNSGTDFKTGFESFKRSISIPIMNAADINVNSGVNKIAELEKLSRLKENGNISEEEFQQLKSKIL